jgi:hypothetical protein
MHQSLADPMSAAAEVPTLGGEAANAELVGFDVERRASPFVGILPVLW